MTFRIETAARGTVRVFILSGRIETQAIAELKRLFEQTDYPEIVLDLKDVGVIDREVVFATFFAGAAEVAEMFSYFQAHTYLGLDSYHRIALANKIAGRQPSKFST
jgi:hypothetical protein